MSNNQVTKTSWLEFMRQVRVEGAKVTWPSYKETMITAAVVVVMVILASIFFLITDWSLSFLIGLLLGT